MNFRSFIVALSLSLVASPVALAAKSGDANVEASTDQVLTSMVRIQLDNFKTMLDAIDHSQKKADLGDERATQAYNDATATYQSALKLHQSGDEAGAADEIHAAYRQIAPAMMYWGKHAPASEREKVAKSLTDTVAQELSTIDDHLDGAPADVVAHYDAAKALHDEAKGLRDTDERASFAKERQAMVELGAVLKGLEKHKAA